MTTTCKLVIDTRRQREDNTYPLMIRIFHNRVNTTVTLNISVQKKDWDAKNRRIRNSCTKFEDLARINNNIAKTASSFNDQIIKLRDKNLLDGMTIVQLKNELTGKKEKLNFIEYAQRLVDSFEKIGKLGNADIYRDTINFMKRYTSKTEIPFSQITYSLLKKIEEDYLSKKNSVNGLSVYLRTVRAIYNKAIKEGLIEDDKHPFKNFVIKKEETRKRAISKDHIKTIEELELAEGSPIWFAKNYFLFSFYCRGMNFIDISKLQVKNLINGRIIYRRSKSRDRKIYSIEITDKIQNILDKFFPFTDLKNPESYIFPVIKRTEPVLQRKDIINGRRIFNDYLKEIAKECKISDTLTSYVARHTWANSAKKMGFSTEIIKDGMGHSDVKTTEIYLENFDDKVLDEANKRITE